MEQSNKLVAGAVIGAVAVVVLGFLFFSQDDAPSQPGSTPVAQGVGCTLTGAAVGLIVDGLSRGRTSGAVYASLGGTAAGAGCNQIVKSLIEQPTVAVPVTIQSGAGRSSELLSGSELISVNQRFTFAPPPTFEATESPSITIDPELRRKMACLGWDSDFLRQACYDGTISPPSR